MPSIFAVVYDADGELNWSSAVDPSPVAPGQVVLSVAAPTAGQVWDKAARVFIDGPPPPAPPAFVPRTVKSIQKIDGTIPSQVWPVGSTVKVFPMPKFQVADATYAVAQNVWWLRVSGSIAQPLFICADVTGPNEVTVVVNNMGAASFTASLRVGGTVVEYG